MPRRYRPHYHQETSVGRRFCPPAGKKKNRYRTQGAAQARIDRDKELYPNDKQKYAYFCLYHCRLWHIATEEEEKEAEKFPAAM